jgi:transcriptional regulator with XRE-family HTH domain
MDIRAIVAANVRRLRLAAELSQEALADAAAIDRTYMSGIERGRRNPSLLVLQRLADALRVEIAQLVERRSK